MYVFGVVNVSLSIHIDHRFPGSTFILFQVINPHILFLPENFSNMNEDLNFRLFLYLEQFLTLSELSIVFFHTTSLLEQYIPEKTIYPPTVPHLNTRLLHLFVFSNKGQYIAIFSSGTANLPLKLSHSLPK